MDYAQTLLLLGALTGTLVSFAKFGPLRWLWKQIVHKPIREGLSDVILEEVLPLLTELKDEMTTNGGSTLRDAVNRLEVQGGRLEQKIVDVQAGVDEAKATAIEVRHELEISVLAGQNRLPPDSA